MGKLRLQYVDDVHTEFQDDDGLEFAKCLTRASDDVDVLILGGDIGSATGTELGDFLRTLCDHYPDVLMVAGNHEFYGTTIDDGKDALNELASKITNLTFLDNSTTTIKGQRFVGSTMWFPQTAWTEIQAKRWSDFQYIKGLRKVYGKLAEKDQKFLDATVTPDDIVITHYVPLNQCNDPRFADDGSNCFFIVDQTKLITKQHPKVWLYGHTHLAKKTVLPNGTILIVNAYGYEEIDLLVQGFDYECTLYV